MDSAADRAAAAVGQPGPSSGGASNKRPAQQQPPPHITQASRRTKKNGRGRRTNQHSRSDAGNVAASSAANGAAGGANNNSNNSDDLVRVVPVPPDSVLLQEDGWRPVRLSATDHAPQARVDPESGTLASTKGYCTARGTHGASEGTWYFEVELTSLGGRAAAEAAAATAAAGGPSSLPSASSPSSPPPSSPSFYLGAARVGWATRAAELQAPVGYDKHGYAFRDREGCKVHDALREPYLEEEDAVAVADAGGAVTKTATAKAEEEKEDEEQEEQKRKQRPSPPPLPPPVKQGDVIGCYLHLPPGGRPLERTKEDIVSWKGGLFFVDRPEAPAAPVRGSAVAFYLNGRRLGVAFPDILEGTYYPAGSLFTPPPPPRGGGGGGGAAAAAAAAAAASEAEKEKEKEPSAAAAATTPLGLNKKKISFGPFDAVATFNFGPRFRFPPSEVPREGLPEARPACEMAGPPP